MVRIAAWASEPYRSPWMMKQPSPETLSLGAENPGPFPLESSRPCAPCMGDLQKQLPLPDFSHGAPSACSPRSIHPTQHPPSRWHVPLSMGPLSVLFMVSGMGEVLLEYCKRPSWKALQGAGTCPGGGRHGLFRCTRRAAHPGWRRLPRGERSESDLGVSREASRKA